MKVVILHADVTAESGKDEQDVLVQADAVESALRELGHPSVRLPVTLDLQKIERDLARLEPDLVFNLVESLAGTGRFVHFAPLLLEHLSIPFTGSGSEALYVTTGKALAKERLRYAAVATPDWAAGDGPAAPEVHFAPPYIVKPVWEDASVGLDDTSIVRDGGKLAEVYRLKTARHGSCFVE
jgi:D-alanine-D-alanine ligase